MSTRPSAEGPAAAARPGARTWHGLEVRDHRLGAGELRRLRDEPHQVLLEAARGGGDLVWLRAGPFRALLAVHPLAIGHVLRDGWKTYDRKTLQYRLLSGVAGQGLLTLDGTPWLERRRTAQPAFHRSHIAGYLELMTAAAKRVEGAWQAAAEQGARVDVVQDMSRFALDVLGGTLLGPAAGLGTARDDLVHATEVVLEEIMARSRALGLLPTWLPTRGNRRYRRARGALDTVIGEAIRRARAGRETGDLVRMLIDPAARVALTDDALRDELVTFVIAGHETVASALAWTWLLLALHPDAADRAAASARAATDLLDPSGPSAVLGATFHEALRLYPPAWVISRRSVGEDRIGPCHVPPRTLTVVSPFATQRLDRFWPVPDRFDPGRFTVPHAHPRDSFLPFGGGPHLCIGNHFALLEGTVALATLGARFRFEAPAAPPAAEAGVTLRPAGGLQMRVRLREPAA